MGNRFIFQVIAVAVIISFIGLIPTVDASVIQLEYFHAPRCLECEDTSPIISDLEEIYGESLNVEKIDVNTPDGWERWHQYGFFEVPAVVVNSTIKIPREEITEENVRVAIRQSLSGTEEESGPPAISWNIPLAYSLGLFSGFSPCLMAILGFILVYVTGSCKGLRSSLMNSLIFGMGLVAAYIIMGCCVLLVGISLGRFGPYLSVAAGLITILAGVSLTGLITFPVTTNNFIDSSVRKYSTSLAGLFLLGMLFSIVKAPCAAPMILILLSKILIDGTIQDLSLLLIFGLGVLTPFIGIGIFGGYVSLSKIREYREIMKVSSGIILIGFGVWLLF
ncbi:cytochrome c biogenesis protein CcdA [Methanofollis sp. W23]|uniref:urease accessory protein UreH domain-containing protein n=1 Tax=Methanofollis sp. W23 TaxID=2817849 RepID=UPI001AE6D36D|nr:cytochrome c biogenesis protein CcdA [Methanofollis sp. W23]MBP2147186.1 cytochrome c biogenesis protein CcdA [Methanofollis sp. W23]